MSLKIAADRSLPLKFLSLRKVVFGGSGSGKTSFARVIFEEAVDAGVLCGAIDLKGDFWGLKSTADGRGDGIPVVIFGGEHQDVPLDEAGGAFLADIIVELRQPFIVDLEQLSKGKQLRFLGAFLERLYDRNRDPLVLICDEADRYAPQKPMSPEANICLGAAEDVAKRGRKHGIFPTFITQRNASLNKGVSELCDVAVVFRTPGPRDQEAVEDWFGTKATREQRDKVMQALAGLADGTAVMCSAHPAFKFFATVAMRLPRTFDSSATPEIGKRRIEPKRLAAPDMAQLRTKMAATIEKARADDPKALRARIHQLEVDLKKAAAATPAPAGKTSKPEDREQLRAAGREIARLRKALEAAMKFIVTISTHNFDVAGVDNAELEKAVTAAVDRVAKMIEDRLAGRGRELKRLRDQAEQLAAALAKVRDDKTVEIAVEVTRNEPFTVATPAPRRSLRPAAGPGQDLPKGERAVLTAIAQHPDGVSREQLTILTGYKRSTRDSYIQRLGEKGHVDATGDRIVATQAGADALGADFEPLPTGDALREHWLGRLPEGERVVLEVLIGAYPKAVERDVVSEATGYKRSTRDSYLQRLGSRRLVVTERTGVRASEALFG